MSKYYLHKKVIIIINFIITCIIVIIITVLQMPDVTEDESVRIFVEFDRIDSAIKGWL